jgi:acetylornithine/succinyldiaminopimelate/putrescine aminotransferase
MVFVDLAPYAVKAPEFVARCRTRGVLVLPYPPTFVRFVMCRNVDETDVRTAADIVADVCESVTRREPVEPSRARRRVLSVDRPWTAG